MEPLAFASAAAEPIERTSCDASWSERETLVALVAERFAVSASDLDAPTRGSAAVAFARQAAMYLAHVSFRANFTEIGRAFGRDRTTAAHACRLVEERRDDPAFDALLEQLERALSAAHSPRVGGRQ